MGEWYKVTAPWNRVVHSRVHVLVSTPGRFCHLLAPNLYNMVAAVEIGSVRQGSLKMPAKSFRRSLKFVDSMLIQSEPSDFE